MDDFWLVLIVVSVFLLSIAMFYGAHIQLLHAYLIADLPFSKTNGVFVGLVSVQGTAETVEPKMVPFTQTQCIVHQWSVCEEWRRWETETYRDKNGHWRTRRVLKTGAETIASGSFTPPYFYLKDETGILRVVLEGVQIPMRDIFYKKVNERKNPELYNSVKAPPVCDSTGIRRFYESGIVLHDPLFVVGNALYNDQETIVEIRDDKNVNTPYIISYSAPKETVKSCGCSYIVLVILSVTIWLFYLHVIAKSLRNPSILVWGTCIIGVLCFLCWLYVRYLTIIDLKNKVKQALSNIDVQLQRRTHLIPQLVACVQGMTTYEGEVQPLLAELRKRIADENANIHGCVPVVNSIVEHYPMITADANFRAFQDELMNTEQKIALVRTYGNNVIMYYNTRISRFPECLIARIARLKELEYIQISDIEHIAPDIELAK